MKVTKEMLSVVRGWARGMEQTCFNDALIVYQMKNLAIRLDSVMEYAESAEPVFETRMGKPLLKVVHDRDIAVKGADHVSEI
jgi:hypothetical protein